MKSPEIQTSSSNIETALKAVDHLPVSNLRGVLRDRLKDQTNFVLVGETGSGKTTCLPPILSELVQSEQSGARVAVTQPRRVAARSVSARVAEMLDTHVGEGVGYHVRFDDQTSSETDIAYLTDGILLRKIQYDPLLLEYSAVMVDEAHERSLNIDLCLGLLKSVNLTRAQNGVAPLRIVITSATIDSGKFARYLGDEAGKNQIEIPGKIFPVETHYLDDLAPNSDFTQVAAQVVSQIVEADLEGDILIFMPGKKEIKQTIEQIKSLPSSLDLKIYSLHAELPPEEQDKIFTSQDKRKVIVSTNIAETSVTIDGIRHVIDSGKIKQNLFDPYTGTAQLRLVDHSLSGLEQRKGRAGRTAPGHCYRLFPESSLKNRPLYSTPEILRSNLDQVILTMKKAGIKDIPGFDFIDAPPRPMILHSLNTLKIIGALDSQGRLTETGHLLADLGIEPKLGRLIVEAIRLDPRYVPSVCTLAALIEGKHLFVFPDNIDDQLDAKRSRQSFSQGARSDYEVMLKVYDAFVKNHYSVDWAISHFLNEKTLVEAQNLQQDILEKLSQLGLYLDHNDKIKLNPDIICQIVLSGFSQNLLVSDGKFAFNKVDGTKDRIFIHPDSVLADHHFPYRTYLIASEIFTGPNGKTYASNCQMVNPNLLPEHLRFFHKSKKGHHRR